MKTTQHRRQADIETGNHVVLLADTAGDPVRWAEAHREYLRGAVIKHGAVMIRGFGLRDVAQVEAAFRRLGSLMIEREALAGRRRYSESIYSASKWPPNQPISMHHELSYAFEFPSLMLFACLTAPASGGATPVADARAVLRALPVDLVERFASSGWLLVRNYNDEIGASLVESFGTDESSAVERYCRANAISFEWQQDGGLRTWQRRNAIVRHPRSGERCWFNQIAFLSEWTMDAELRGYLVDVHGEDGLPFNTRFGDGAPIDAGVVQQINEAYEANTSSEPWQSGDLMLVDNISTAHARERFQGQREVIVAMADATLADCPRTIDSGCS